jgi:hypothetical protein
VTVCSSDGCDQPAVAWMRFADMGELLHVHVCPVHEMIDREWCDVIESGELPCPPRLLCTADALFVRQPPLLIPED